MTEQQFPDANTSQKHEAACVNTTEEEFKVVIQLIRSATPVPRDKFKNELGQRLFGESAPTTHTPSKRFPSFPSKSLISAASLVAALLIGVAGLYALGTLVQRAIQMDGGLSPDAGQALDLSHTVNGYTTSAEWIYADTSRISIGLSVALEPDQATIVGVAPGSKARLIDDSGLEYPLMSAVGTGVENNAIGAVYSFTMPGNLPAPTELLLNLSLDLWLISADQAQLHVGTFQYRIPTRVSSLQEKFNIPQTVTAAGIDVTLASVEVTPSLTRIKTCFEVNDTQFSDWFPNVQLQVGNRKLHEEQIRIDGSAATSDNCQYTNFYINLLGEEGPWTVNIVELIGTRMLELEQPTQPIPAELFEKRIEGPWTFILD